MEDQEDYLTLMGLFMDDLNKLKVLENQASKDSSDLSEECKFFVEKITEYDKIGVRLLKASKALAAQVEEQKKQALQAKNLLHCAPEDLVVQRQKLQAEILARQSHIEKLHADYKALEKTEQVLQEMKHLL